MRAHYCELVKERARGPAGTYLVETEEELASLPLQDTYARLAEQWIRLAEMAQRTIDVARKVYGTCAAEYHSRDLLH